MTLVLIIGLALLGSAECKVDFNPSNKDPDVIAALTKAGEELKISTEKLYAGQISRCMNESTTVWVWRRDGEQDMLIPWVVRYQLGAWTLEQHQDG
jgi:hypothetical protein